MIEKLARDYADNIGPLALEEEIAYQVGFRKALELAAALFDAGGSYNREQTFKNGEDEVSFTYRVGDIIGENIRALNDKEVE